MPTEIFEDTLDLQVELLETLPIEPGPAYPMPRLRKTGAMDLRTFRTVILENPYLRVTILPALGGRIWSIFDKRMGTEILPVAESPQFKEGGRRGVSLDAGITLRLDGETRLNDLGPVATMIEEGEEPAVWLAETSIANGFSFHQRIALPHDRAEILIEARIQGRGVLNAYRGELSIACGDGVWDGRTFYSAQTKSGFALFSEDLFENPELDGGRLSFARYRDRKYMSQRVVDTWKVSLIPFSGLDRQDGCSLAGACAIFSEGIQLQVSSERMGHKLVLMTEDGRTLEAPVDLYPEHPLQISAEQIGGVPKEIVLLDPAKIEVLRSHGEIEGYGDPWLKGEHVAGCRYSAYMRIANDATRAKNFSKADAYLERALMYNADDPLLWWEKSLVRRLVNPEEENPERLNAHFLAPLEPALRAEAFLSQPMDLGREKSPLLNPLEETPEDFVEVACMYIERGLLDQASRWIDESLRHIDLPMLRILMAYCLIEGTRMDAEAAEHVAAAERSPGPPYPWRQTEVDAIGNLLVRFPANRYLQSLSDMAREGLDLIVGANTIGFEDDDL